MAANRSKDLTLIDGSTTYTFPITEENGARKIIFKSRPWQDADPTYPFRKSLFPIDGGVSRDHLDPASRNYGKNNGDASYPNSWVHPPLLTTITLTNGATPYKFKVFNSKIFVLGGRYMYYIDPTTNTATEDKDFGVGKTAVDMEVFNNELVVAMGESEKIYTRNTSGTWTQATDNTFAIAFGVVDSKLWRGEEVNEISNCITAPRTLASYAPTDGNEYTVGDDTWSINSIVDFQGSIWVGKGDGFYAADPTFIFHNQTPQIQKNPNVDNCKGAFIAHASLWVPFINGLLRIRLGSALPYGPEITWRRDFRFWTRGGIEHNGNIYLICTDEAAGSNTTIFKLVPRDEKRSSYVYHEWCRLGSSTKGYAITVTSGISTNPELMVTHGNDVKYLKLGRGGGADIDDTNYAYGLTGELETGKFMCGLDQSILTVLVGAEVVCDYSAANESLTLSYRIDGQAYANLLTTQEGGGSAAITLTTNFQSVRRYAPTTAEGQFVELKWESVLVTTTSSPEIVDLIAFGYLRPLVTDIITLSLVADGASWSGRGTGNAMDAMETLRLFRDWMNDGSRLEGILYRYDDTKTTRFIVIDVQYGEAELELGAAHQPDLMGNMVVSLVRVPYGISEYAIA